MTKINDLHRRWSKDADYKDAYDALGEEFDLARALIEARTAAGLSQSQLARRMKTSQSYIARVEGGKVRPSTDALERSQGPPGRGSGSCSNRNPFGRRHESASASNEAPGAARTRHATGYEPHSHGVSNPDD